MVIYGSITNDHNGIFLDFAPLDIYGEGNSFLEAKEYLIDLIESNYKLERSNIELMKEDEIITLKVLDSKKAPSFVLRAVRNAENLSLQDVANKLGLSSRSSYAKYEKYDYSISFEKFSQALKAITNKPLLLSLNS